MNLKQNQIDSEFLSNIKGGKKELISWQINCDGLSQAVYWQTNIFGGNGRQTSETDQVPRALTLAEQGY